MAFLLEQQRDVSCHFAEQLIKKTEFCGNFQSKFFAIPKRVKSKFSDAVFQYHSQ